MISENSLHGFVILGNRVFLQKTFTEQMAHVKYLKFHQIKADKNR